MKRIISTILSILMLMSFFVTALATEVPSESEQQSNGITQQLQSEPQSDIETYIDSPAIDLNTSSQSQTAVQNENFTMLEDAQPVKQDIDFSSAVAVNFEVSGDSAMALQDNQAPIANPGIFVLNPETMRDGKYTTATQFFIATRWNNVDLCYDPEGGPISLAFNNTFPSGYITALEDPNGTYAGYAIHVFNRGNNLLNFAFTDSLGAMSPIYSINFDIISRGVFESFDDTLVSADDINEYQIIVDFSTADEYCVGVLRTGTGGLEIYAYDANGEKVKYAYCGGPNNDQESRAKIDLKKPTGVTGTYTYTLRIYTTESKFLDGNTSYRVAYGEKDQSYYFFEDVAECLDMPRFTRFMLPNGHYMNRAINPSDYGDYYKITATGPEVVTLASGSGQQRFKVLSTKTLSTLYDGTNLNSFKPDGYSSQYTSVEINFQRGESYYIVVYNTAVSNTSDAYSITVGDRRLLSGSNKITLPATNFVQGTSYTWKTNIKTPTGLPGYIDYIAYSGADATWSYEGGYFNVLTPGKSTWRSNTPKFYPQIKFGVTSNSTLVRYDGDWSFRINAAETGLYPGKAFTIYYNYEV